MSRDFLLAKRQNDNLDITVPCAVTHTKRLRLPVSRTSEKLVARHKSAYLEHGPQRTFAFLNSFQLRIGISGNKRSQATKGDDSVAWIGNAK